jgi:ferritin-like metal-binding protein YciE
VTTKSTQSGINSKPVEYLNEMLTVENAAIGRIQSRIDESPIQAAKSRLHQHLEETKGQQDRLQEIISKYAGTPTSSKAHLSTPKPPSTELMKNTIKGLLVNPTLKISVNGIESAARGKLLTYSNNVDNIAKKFKSKYGEGDVNLMQQL